MPDAWLIDAARHRVADFTSTLHGATDPSMAVPGLDWSIAEIAQHVAGLPAFWAAQNDAQADWERPTDFAAFSDAARAHPWRFLGLGKMTIDGV